MSFNRPVYENEANMANEDAVARILKSKWRGRILKTAKFYPFDRIVEVDGVIKAFVEIKCYTTKFRQFDSFKISMKKIEWGIDTTVNFGVKCLIVGRWVDVLAFHTVDVDFVYPLLIGGRYDRNDPVDVEVMASIPWGKFKQIT